MVQTTQPEPVRSDSPDDYAESVLRTYRYLRLGMVVLVVLLGTAVVIERIASGRWQPSISAYYYTPAHSVFVAALCGVGACLVIYRGMTDLEDVVLNGAGFLAFVVAFVPTTRGQSTCDPSSAFCDIPDSTKADNVEALFVVGLVGLALGYALSFRPSRPSRLAQPISRAARIAFLVLVAGYVALLAVFLFARQWFLANGHTGSAITLFAGILFVVFLNWRRLRAADARTGGSHQGLVRWYASSFLAMVVAIVVIGVAIWQKWTPYGVLFLEGSLILAFAVYWLTQTFGAVWNDPAEIAKARTEQAY